VFEQRDAGEWGRLIAQSVQWPKVRDAVFARLEARAEAEAADEAEAAPATARALLDGLREASDAAASSRALLDKLLAADSAELEALVALHAEALNESFFDQAAAACAAARAASAGSEGDDALASPSAGTRLSLVVSLREAHRALAADPEKLTKAAAQFDAILSCDSLAEAESTMSDLAASETMEPALRLIMAKAYAGARATDMVKEEAKDVMAHLYEKAREGTHMQQPAELKVLKWVAQLPTLREKRDALEDAFTPGLNYADAGTEYISTTPLRLLDTVEAVLGTYEMQHMKFMSKAGGAYGKGAMRTASRPDGITGSDLFRAIEAEAQAVRAGPPDMQRGGRGGQAPHIIDTLREIRDLIRKEFVTDAERREDSGLVL